MKRPIGIIVSIGIIAIIGILNLVSYFEHKEVAEHLFVEPQSGVPTYGSTAVLEHVRLLSTLFLAAIIVSAILHFIALPLLWMGKNPARYLIIVLVVVNLLNGGYLASVIMLIPLYIVWFDKKTKTYFERK